MKKLNKFLSVFLALMMIISIVPMSIITAGAEETATSGTCGENLTWTFDESTGTLTISGTGEMDDYDYYNQPWANFCENIVNVIIEDGVTSIGSYAFVFYHSIENVHIGENVSVIYDCAFDGCWSLAEVNIPDSVTIIERYAFADCSFEEVEISEYVTYIGNEAFGRGALKNINVSENNNNYASIDGVLFNKDKTSLILYPPCRSESYIIPEGVLNIKSDAFVNSIITDIIISKDVEVIEDGAFWGADDLQRIAVVDGNNNYSSIDGILFNKDKTSILIYPCEKDDFTTYTVPDTVVEIGNLAFDSCGFFEEIILPDNLKIIGDCAFYWCDNISEIQIPDTVTEIGYRAFDSCNSLMTITIPDGVESIGYGLFMHCESLESVVLPDSIKTIEDSVFNDCPKLNDVYYYGTQDNWNSINQYDKSQFSDITVHYNYKPGHYSKEIIKAPTCTEEGELTYTCLCNIIRNDIIPATGHNIADNGICINCGYAYEADVNDDGIISPVDYELVFEYICGMHDEYYYYPDINNDGDVTSLDARLISLYLAGKITDFNVIPLYTESAYKDVSMIFDKRELKAGEKLTLTIDIPENSGIAAAEFLYQIDSSKYTISAITKKNIFENEMVNSFIIGDEIDGVYQVRYAGFSNEAIANGGTLLTIELEARIDMPDASDADYYIEFNGTDNDCNHSNINENIYWGQSVDECTHSSVTTITIPATCTVAGMEYDVCEICGETIGDSTVIPATGHTAGEWETVIEPTYEADGKKVQKCTVCGEVVAEEVIPMLVKVTITDEDTNVSIEVDGDDYDGVVDIVVEESFDGTAFDVIDTSLNASQKFIYDITMTVDGVETQPNGTVKVKLPLPNGYDPNRSFVYHVDTETGKVEKMPATYEEGYMVFETTHFSYYAVVEEGNYTFSIQEPSRTEIRNKDGIILHANVEGNAPAGSYVRWESSNGNFDKSADGSNLKIVAKNKGWTTFTAILCDADGNELARDTVDMYSKSGFFDKIGGFFRGLFGMTKIHEN